ncbi:MAG: hypothetical protein JXR60_04820 [Bacteroidales bacterium]|nr:hypothetical protein [Bacteroidales bacterium]
MNTKILLISLSILSLLSACHKDETDTNTCGSDIFETTINSIPDISYFSLIDIDTANNTYTIAYNGDTYNNICPQKEVEVTVNTTGDYLSVSASIFWSENNQEDLVLTQAHPIETWTSTTKNFSIANVYGDNAGKIWVNVYFKVAYTDNETDLTSIYNHFKNHFSGLYINPYAFEYIP